jgi:DNA-binding NtrC family response regulator
MHKPIILLIEKDTVSLELYQRELSNDFLVLAFPDERGVLEAIAANEVQAVIIEPEMRSGKGWELISQIQVLNCAHHPAIIICAVQDRGHKSMNSGAAAYLIKPVLPKDLLKKVQGVLGTPKQGPKPTR